MTVSENQGFNTRAVHAGQDFEPRTGAVIPPLHFSSTYAQDGIEPGPIERVELRTLELSE